MANLAIRNLKSNTAKTERKPVLDGYRSALRNKGDQRAENVGNWERFSRGLFEFWGDSGHLKFLKKWSILYIPN